MTPEYIKKKAYEVYPKQSSISEGHGVIPADHESHLLGDANEDKREGYIKGFIDAQNEISLNSFYDGRKVAEQEYESLPKIKGWVARDKAGRLGLYDQCPQKDNSKHGIWEIAKTWIGRFDLSRIKPDIECGTDEPIEVELLIRKV